MYSIVLLAAMGGGPNAAGADATPVVAAPAASVIVGGCTGCTGCTGFAYSSCYGCYGGYSYGCCGGYSSCHGCRGGFLGLRSGCHGHKSCHGCCGGYAYSSCYGSCHGCYGSGWGYGYSYGCCGGFGGAWGGCYGTVTYPSYATPPAVVVPTETQPLPKTEPKPMPEKGASLKFKLPAGATLFVDGQATPGEGTERSFFTPPLAAGQKYFYDVRAELKVDGQVVVEEKRVVVETGAVVSEAFPKLIAAAAGQPTTVAGK